MSRLVRLVPACRVGTALLATVLALSCSRSSADDVPLLTAERPLHLEDHIDAARVEASELPAEALEPVEWTFDRPQSDWHPIPDASADMIATPEADGVRLELSQVRPGGFYVAAMYAVLPDWDHRDWGQVRVRARATGGAQALRLFFNTRPGPDGSVWPALPGGEAYVIRDGSVHSYQLPADQFAGPPLTDAWQQLVVTASGVESGSVDILSVSVVPRTFLYADAPAGVRTEQRGEAIRRTLYLHAPGRMEYRVRVPEDGRLDFGMGVVRPDEPVTFRVAARPDGEEPQLLFEERFSDASVWRQRSVDLSHLAGKELSLSLEAAAEEPGAIGLFAAPTLSGGQADDRPNVIFYIIDGAAASYMSVYGYNRRTTPFLERLAAEGAVFERAYSNSTWTKPSTTSYVTSLHSSVLGNWKTEGDLLPDGVVTMAERFHRAGYQTALFTTNSYAGLISGLDRGHDVMREAGSRPNSISSSELHEDFWRWRAEYPGGPFFAHFQTTDVHFPYDPPAPFAGLFLDPEDRKVYDEWRDQLQQWGLIRAWFESFEESGISRPDFYAAQRRLYDECMAHNDAQLARLVERLKAEGEWENTLLVVAADHGAGWWVMDIDPPPPFSNPVFAAYWTRIPLIVVWPGRIAGGQSFSEPVSMIDVLPTLLELTGGGPPSPTQGRSFAPLLLGTGAWEPRPVIFDEARDDAPAADEEKRIHIEVVDGRWGASLIVAPDPGSELVLPEGRAADLLVYDLWKDPNALTPINEERPELVDKYRKFLEAQWSAHQALAQHVGAAGGEVALTPEQLETLRSLGYIQ